MNTTVKNIGCVGILLCALITGCKKSNTDADPSNSYFPNSVGNKYTYSVVDSVSHTTYNVNVAVVGKSKLSNGKPVTIWTYTSPNCIDTNYVYSNKDSAVVYDKYYYISTIAHFPLTVGAKWALPYAGPYISEVVSVSSLNTPGGTFTNAFLIHEYGSCCNYSITLDQWYVPNIGIVKQNIAERMGRYQFWTLKSYQIN